MFVVSNRRKGLTVERDGTSTTVRPDSGAMAVAVVTSARTHFAVGGAGDEGDWREAIHHAEVADVTVRRTLVRTNKLSVTTRDDATYRFYVPRGTVLSNLSSYLAEVVDCWGTVEGHLSRVEGRMAAIERHLESGEIEDAHATYRDLDQSLERARDAADAFGARPDGPISRRIESVATELDRSLATCHARRGDQIADRGEKHWARGEYERAHELFRAARSQYERALSITERHDVSAPEVERRRADLLDRLDELEAEPLGRAERARSRTMATDDPGRAVSAWREALDRYRQVLELGWGDPGATFDGDTDALRFQISWIVGRLLAARRSYAAELVGDAEAATRDDRPERAHQLLTAAAEQLGAARDLSREYRTGDPAEVEREIRTIERKLDRTDRRAWTPDLHRTPAAE
ncbi:hypothetical protein BRC83_01005 [Halobacteriales archaeon QS_1_68_17]|nr:MAG: hypothetical protein BRC83_01005 [Halobacteriales archaeon QS_1_68_17]